MLKLLTSRKFWKCHSKIPNNLSPSGKLEYYFTIYRKCANNVKYQISTFAVETHNYKILHFVLYAVL